MREIRLAGNAIARKQRRIPFPGCIDFQNIRWIPGISMLNGIMVLRQIVIFVR